MTITLIAGARPNFMKIAPIIEAIEKAAADGKNISYRLVHTGQHYDKNMSGSFLFGTRRRRGTNPANIAPALKKLMAGEWKKGGIPEKWDGKAAERIVEKLLKD